MALAAPGPGFVSPNTESSPCHPEGHRDQRFCASVFPPPRGRAGGKPPDRKLTAPATLGPEGLSQGTKHSNWGPHSDGTGPSAGCRKPDRGPEPSSRIGSGEGAAFPGGAELGGRGVSHSVRPVMPISKMPSWSPA